MCRVFVARYDDDIVKVSPDGRRPIAARSISRRVKCLAILQTSELELSGCVSALSMRNLARNVLLAIPKATVRNATNVTKRTALKAEQHNRRQVSMPPIE